MELKDEIIMWAVGIVCTVMTTVVVPFLATWLKSKTNNENLSYIINELSNTVATSVDCIQQTMVDQMKADGNFDVENQQKALKAALDMSINSLSETAKNILSKEGIDIEALIIKYIEAKVSENKIYSAGC